jgi:hypothetical protein
LYSSGEEKWQQWNMLFLAKIGDAIIKHCLQPTVRDKTGNIA